MKAGSLLPRPVDSRLVARAALAVTVGLLDLVFCVLGEEMHLLLVFVNAL
jgi:hypothetical protein